MPLTGTAENDFNALEKASLRRDAMLSAGQAEVA